MDARVDGTASGQVAEYLDRVTARDVRGARGLLLSEVTSRGDGLVEVIDELFVPAMAEVGVRDATKAAHAVGIPVLAGGAGLGPDDRRARAVGADGWAGRPAEAVPLLWRWSEQPPAFATPAPEDREVAALRRLRDFFRGRGRRRRRRARGESRGRRSRGG